MGSRPIERTAMKSLLSNRTPVRFLLKIRPMAIGLLDKRKIRYWDALDKPLGDLIRREGMEDFLDEISYARVPASDTDWSAMPLYMLVDYLTHEHRNILLQEVADISHLLDIHTIAVSDEAEALRKIHMDFQAWVKEFQAHIEQEEVYLFPKVLRYEACLRDREVHPEFHHGSIQTYMAAQESQVGKHVYRECGILADRMRAHVETWPGSISGFELAEISGRLRAKLDAHYELENQSLYTAARELERSIYNKSIGGDPAMAYHRRGPMDSGILRLDLG
jgi:iron-sulfur cluster repair protein YtfE (RIC family)